MGQQDMRTPRWLFNFLQDHFKTTYKLDAFADKKNHLCKKYATKTSKKGDGLTRPWIHETFANPPFSLCEKVVAKACLEAWKNKIKSTLILPVGCSQIWFHKYILNACATIYLPDTRIWFLNPDGTWPKNKDGRVQGGDRDTMIVRFASYSEPKISPLKIKDIQKQMIRSGKH